MEGGQLCSQTGALSIVYLRTLGHPALLGADGLAGHKLRKKDLALLVYLCMEGTAVHSRGRLASLLWGESAEDAARHSLTQALSRLIRALPPGSLVADNRVVRWEGTLPCDAVLLLRGGLGPADVDVRFSIYQGEFLRGFHPGRGAEEFMHWADGRRADLRNAALRLLESAGYEAEERRDWPRAVELAERAVAIDPIAENARRRLMRAWAALGERNVALRQYRDYAGWLKQEMGAEPDPDTRALAEQLRAAGADPPRADTPVRQPPAPGPPPAPFPPPPPPPAPLDPPPPGSPEDAADPPAVERTGPVPPRARRARVAVGTVLLLLGTAIALGVRGWRRPPPDPVGHGETLRERGSAQTYLAFAETLYAYPDRATLRACTGLRAPAVREVRTLPPWPRRQLPSAREHRWMGGSRPVVSDHPVDKTAYVAAGCILAGVPDTLTLDSIFGPGSVRGMTEAPQAAVDAMPRAFIARGHPVRRAGTLIRSPDGRLGWITYHGGALAVADSALLATWCRTPGEAVDVGAREFRYYRPYARLHPARTDCGLSE